MENGAEPDGPPRTRQAATGGEGVQEGTDPGDVLQPFLTVLDGRVVPYNDLVSAGRSIAHALVAKGWPVVLCGESHWAGVWDVERLTDGEAVDRGLWVAGWPGGRSTFPPSSQPGLLVPGCPLKAAGP
jgi:hypothetical protein